MRLRLRAAGATPPVDHLQLVDVTDEVAHQVAAGRPGGEDDVGGVAAGQGRHAHFHLELVEAGSDMATV